MLNYFKTKAINRIIDANINRAKEGLRVSEEITRFVLGSVSLTTKIKSIRHRINSLAKAMQLPLSILLEARNSLRDIGRQIYVNELKRKDISDILFANLQRAKESVRVLEEFSKLKNKKLAVNFKNIRYAIYELEKKVAKKILSLRSYR